AVALRADADCRVAGQHRADLDGLDTSLDQLVDQHVAHIVTGRGEDLARLVHDVGRQGTGEHRVLDIRVAGQHTLRVGSSDRELETVRRAAVLLADDDVLRDVHQTTGQVTRVSGTQSRVGQTLTGTVRRDEVLRHRQTLAVRGDDRTGDDLTL